MPRASPSAFVCDVCGKEFTRKHDLYRHGRTHEADAQRYYCAHPDCEYSSLQKSNLKTHYSSRHLLQRPYQCELNGCTRAYRDPSALLRHEKNDHGYYRKDHVNPYSPRPLRRPGGLVDLDESVFIKGASEQTPASTASQYESQSSAVTPSLASTSSLGTSSTLTASSSGVQNNAGPSSSGQDLQGSLPDSSTQPEGNPDSASYPSFNNPGGSFQSNEMLEESLRLEMPRLEDIAPVNEVLSPEFWSYWLSLA